MSEGTMYVEIIGLIIISSLSEMNQADGRIRHTTQQHLAKGRTCHIHSILSAHLKAPTIKEGCVYDKKAPLIPLIWSLSSWTTYILSFTAHVMSGMSANITTMIPMPELCWDFFLFISGRRLISSSTILRFPLLESAEEDKKKHGIATEFVNRNPRLVIMRITWWHGTLFLKFNKIFIYIYM